MDRRLWWAPAWIVAGLGSILVEGIAAAGSTVPYSFTAQTISDLGMTTCTDAIYAHGPVAVCSPLHPLANTVWALAQSS